MLNLVSQDGFDALTVADCKAHLNVTSNTDDDLIGAYLRSAVNYVERETSLDLRATTWQLVIEQFPFFRPGTPTQDYIRPQGELYYVYPQSAGWMLPRWQEIELYRSPVVQIDSVKYYDTTGVLVTLDPTTYYLVAYSYQPAKLYPLTSWPTTFPRMDAVRVTFSTGIGAGPGGSGSGTGLPEQILHAIRLLVGTSYYSREDIAYGPETVSGQLGDTVKNLLCGYTVRRS